MFNLNIGAEIARHRGKIKCMLTEANNGLTTGQLTAEQFEARRNYVGASIVLGAGSAEAVNAAVEEAMQRLHISRQDAEVHLVHKALQTAKDIVFSH